MEDFFSFKKMVTPAIIKILFVVGAILTVLAGLSMVVAGVSTSAGGVLVLVGLLYVVLGPIIVRIYCEILILFFRIYETLLEIKNNTAK